MAYERAKNVVVMERPVHNTVVGVSLRGAKNALVVVGELHQINPVVLVVVGVDLPKVSFKFIRLKFEV